MSNYLRTITLACYKITSASQGLNVRIHELAQPWLEMLTGRGVKPARRDGSMLWAVGAVGGRRGGMVCETGVGTRLRQSRARFYMSDSSAM